MHYMLQYDTPRLIIAGHLLPERNVSSFNDNALATISVEHD